MSYSQYAVVGNIGNYDGPLPLRFFQSYANFHGAVLDMPAGALLFMMPGTYLIPDQVVVSFNKKLTVVGLGMGASDVSINRIDSLNNRNALRIANGCDAIFENLSINANYRNDNTFLYGALNNAKLRLNNVYLRGGGSTFTDSRIFGTNGVSVLTPRAFDLTHCTLNPNTRHTVGSFLSGQINRAHFGFEKCSMITPFSVSAGTDIIGEWDFFDIEPSPTNGYGADYAQSLFTDYSMVNLSSRVIDLQGGAAKRVVAFHWQHPERYHVIDIDNDGNWSQLLPPGVQFGIYYLSAREIYPPMVHGPYTAT